MSKQHILFLTGRLAEKRLRRILEAMQSRVFTYEIVNIGVSVAALMTADMIKRRLQMPGKPDRVIIPGFCRGDLDALGAHFKVPFVRGPIDLKDLPAFFGKTSELPDLSAHDVLIFAEIVEAPELQMPEIMARAEKYRAAGADVIDLGCLPSVPFPHLETAIETLHEAGFKISVDSMLDDELLRAGNAGADFLLSLNSHNLWIADEVAAVPVLIPDEHDDLDSMYRVIEQFADKGKPFMADCILDPIHFGFTESIVRYHALRQQCPDIEIMMGVGNLTELTEADTTGINALLFGIISELGINAILTTEVSAHACTAVKEADRARRIMYAAKEQAAVPKGFDSSLLTTHARKPFPYSPEEIAELAAEIKDPSYRVQVSKQGIHVYNRDGMVVAQGPFELFPQLELLQADSPHAFYMGVELARAQIAWQLGKRYVQDEELAWGVATDDRQQAATGHTLKSGQSKLSPDPGTVYKKAGSTMQAAKLSKRKRKKKAKNS